MIELRAVRKSYGSAIALDGLSMHVPEKAVYGLVGPAGSGKSSVMELLAGLSRPDEGEILVDGLREGSERRRWKRRIGYMPDFSGLYPEMRLSEYLEFFSACYDIPRARARHPFGSGRPPGEGISEIGRSLPGHETEALPRKGSPPRSQDPGARRAAEGS